VSSANGLLPLAQSQVRSIDWRFVI